ncbi:hypothetical protein BSPWISOXPB_9382 [uncultured Gammaproteobacteria bacterium]|nr:hypothetical protein BSPWISOXPB_2441 [uncultured Gammaproteobacteria bacterium]VVM25037.1 hypothetical protein BSPWISOXPB_9382 [uncultured Gammaproteobacteria bacterium]
MDDYQKLVAKALVSVDEILPWDLEEEIEQNSDLILLDIREQAEFEMMHIKDALHVARGVLEGLAFGTMMTPYLSWQKLEIKTLCLFVVQATALCLRH